MLKMSWNKAVAVSICLHLVVLLALAGTGLLSLKADEPTNLELEILDDSQPAKQQASGISLPPAATREAPIQPALQSAVKTDVATDMPLPFDNAATVPAAAIQSPAGPVAADSSISAAPTARPSGARILAPRILQKKDPVYPPEARRQGVEGKVTLKIEVQVDGRAGEILVLNSSGTESLDEAAVAAVRQWRFVPAREEDTGMPVRRFTTVTIAFEIN